jgi:hypothetical protein
MLRAMLTLYRRHTIDCQVPKTRLSTRAKRRYMDCQCPIWIYGRTRDALVPRQSTGTRDLAVAEAQRQSLLKQGQDVVAHGPRIDDCVERFLESHRSKLGEKTAAHTASNLSACVRIAPGAASSTCVIFR